MNKLLKTFAWLALFTAFATFAFLGFASTQGTLNVTVNGQQVEGAQKLIIGSVGFLIAGVATLVAVGIAALAAAGSGLILFICLAFVALVLVAVSIPFLLPLLIPILVVAFILMLCRHKPKANVA
jgi:hypothetical protein